jgi:hypothetical protein
MASYSRGYFVHNRFEYRLVIWIKIKGFIYMYLYTKHVDITFMCAYHARTGEREKEVIGAQI